MKAVILAAVLLFLGVAAHAEDWPHIGAGSWLGRSGQLDQGVTVRLAGWKSITRPGHLAEIDLLAGTRTQGFAAMTDLWTDATRSLWGGLGFQAQKLSGAQWAPCIVFALKIRSAPK